ncbi:hypothetical protein CRUP_012126 [Coryphaenoides rupestris]|nr:hypothetical protein CRUP_012126 [Coryphaenoides rupestris]
MTIAASAKCSIPFVPPRDTPVTANQATDHGRSQPTARPITARLPDYRSTDHIKVPERGARSGRDCVSVGGGRYTSHPEDVIGSSVFHNAKRKTKTQKCFP